MIIVIILMVHKAHSSFSFRVFDQKPQPGPYEIHSYRSLAKVPTFTQNSPCKLRFDVGTCIVLEYFSLQFHLIGTTGTVKNNCQVITCIFICIEGARNRSCAQGKNRDLGRSGMEASK